MRNQQLPVDWISAPIMSLIPELKGTTPLCERYVWNDVFNRSSNGGNALNLRAIEDLTKLPVATSNLGKI